MNKKIVIGIPSYNESDTIGYVVKQIDLGLRKFYPTAKCLIMNVDSNSEDNTKKVFLTTKTFSPKKYLNTGKKTRGKGQNLIELFKYCRSKNIDFVVVLDSDIKTVKPNWVFLLLNPLISGKIDYTAPVYARGCYDGNVTNNFAYPMTYARFDIDLQQPIGGEFGLNKHLYEYLLKQPINAAVLGFGIDIFMTYHAIGAGFRIKEVYLGRKKHRPGFSSLMGKFLQFSQSAIEVSRIYHNRSSQIKPLETYKNITIFKTCKQPNKRLASIRLKQFSQEFKKNLSEYPQYLGKELTDKIAQVLIINKKPTLSSTLWTDALAKFLKICYQEDFNSKLIPKIDHLLAPIFYWRAISFWGEMKNLPAKEIDKIIRNQAKLLRKKLIGRS